MLLIHEKTPTGTGNLEVLFTGHGYSRELFCKIKQNYDFSLVNYSLHWYSLTRQTKNFVLGQKSIFKNLCKHLIFKGLRKSLSTSYKNENQLEF